MLAASKSHECGKEGRNEASSLQKIYEDWRVACAAIGQEKRCGLSQERRQQNGRRVLGIEVVPTEAGGLVGALILPFGLRPDTGIVLAVDGAAIMGFAAGLTRTSALL